MTALRAHTRGGPEVLVAERAVVPVPAAGEVLVAVHAAAITFDELTWDETWTRDGVSRTPVIPSHEVSGVVAEVGSEVMDFKIDVRAERFDETGAAYDVVIDTVGAETLDRSFGVLRRGGWLVTLSAPPPAGKADEYGITATFFIVTLNRGQLDELTALVDSGRLQVEIAATFPLDRGREAFASGLSPGRRPGKTVLIVRD